MRAIWGKHGGDMGEIQGGYMRDMGEIWGRYTRLGQVGLGRLALDFLLGEALLLGLGLGLGRGLGLGLGLGSA